jgi:alpha-glucoside transport system permease protein
MTTKVLETPKPAKKLFASRPATIIVWFITLLWTIPSLSLLVTSFRSKEDVYNSGWWTTILNPKFTLDSYHTVFFG